MRVHNFIGHRIQGYGAGECILSRDAAVALSRVQAKLKILSLSLKVYDCYRPQMAVNEFISWSKKIDQQQMKSEFYPRVNKADFLKLGYVAEKSGHSRGSTVDVTIVPIPVPKQSAYQPGQALVSCIKGRMERFNDNSIDMGTGYDCMDELSHSDSRHIKGAAYQHRLLLKSAMRESGFDPYPQEWWHFTLKDEPYPDAYFNFVVQ